ncbi:PR domain zinc finger protein 14 [Bulinus truncatus]|nr:PR domain zinc finger protein 14 [Bulinus truncatus]
MEQVRPGPSVFPFYAPHFGTNLASMTPDRFRFPIQPHFQFAPAVMFHGVHPQVVPQPMPASHHIAACSTLPRMSSPAVAPVTPVAQAPRLTFTQEELDMVLYGYTKGRTSDRYHGHALSGLKFGHVSHSIDKILCDHRTTPESLHNVSLGSSHSNSSSSSGVDGGHHNSNTSGGSHSASCGSGSSRGGLAGGGGGSFSSPQAPHGATTPACKQVLSGGSGNGSMSTVTDSVNTNMPPLDSVSLELPEGLSIYQTNFAGTGHTGVFCTRTVISRSTRFGPFKGRVVHTSETKTRDDNSCMWEIFQDGKLSHFIDGRCPSGSWMSYVNCARYAQEQNLIAVQIEGEIWYEACKDIPQGTELLVWYGDCYLQFMGVPVALKEMADGGAQEEVDTLTNSTPFHLSHVTSASEGFSCERCGKVFAYKYYRDKHLKYTRCVDQGDRKYPCHLCSRSFEKRDRLRIHILHVHEKHRPHKCVVCSKSFSQSSSLNKHMRVHSGERPYKCVYCNKAFTASSILRTHIRQHSGEKPFKCKHCGKAFASHAAHDSHVRRTHAKERPCSCHVCGRTFQQPYELKFHMGSHMQ